MDGLSERPSIDIVLIRLTERNKYKCCLVEGNIMKVLCTLNNIFEVKDVDAVDRMKKYIHLSDGQMELEKNVEYCVYGIVFRGSAPWYYLCLDEDDECPSPYPAELFIVTDERLSSYWRISTEALINGVLSSLVFEEWAKDSSFYERLINDDSSALELFKRYQCLMDQE